MDTIWRFHLVIFLAALVSGCDPNGELGRGAAAEGEDEIAAEEAQQPGDPRVTQDTQVVVLPQTEVERP
jgi:hypothetical protein